MGIFVFKWYKMRTILIILLFTFISFRGYSQNFEEKGFDKNRLFSGGNFGLQLGTYTVIDVSPIIGYRFTERFSAGVGGIYQYYGYKNKYYPGLNFNTNIYGGKTFIRFYILDYLFAHGEYEVLSLETEYFDPSRIRHLTERFLVHSVLVGGGYAQRIGMNSAINLMLLYNINETVDTPYRNPILRMGFDIGF